MISRRVLILLLLVAATSTLSANGELQAPDNKGTDFFLAFPQNGDIASRAPTLTLFIANEAPAAATVEISRTGFSPFTIPVAASSVVEARLTSPFAQITTPNAISDRGIRVRSVDPLNPTQEGLPIAVYAWSRQPFGGNPNTVGDGAYVVSPIDVLGTEYLTVSRPGNSQVTVVATQYQTTVQITQAGGAIQKVVLDQGYVYVLQDPGDLTGALVSADKPIAVFSGNRSARADGSMTSVDHMIEQMVPVSALGSDALVARIAPDALGATLIRVVAYEGNTEVRIDGELKATLAARKFYDFTLPQAPPAPAAPHSWVSTSKPALVAEYKSGDNSGTDPFLMLVPPVNQFSRDYFFRVPGTPFSNFLTIVVKEGDEAGLLLNDAPVPAGAWTSVNGYRYARVSVPAGTNRLVHQEPTVRFGAWVYGHSTSEGYGYAAGQLVNTPPDCSTAAPSTALIWPPNQQLVPINVNGVVDPNGDEVTIAVTSIFQDEPTNDTGDGDTAIDGFGIGGSTAQVRAERSGDGNGRVYHIGFTATDPWGASCAGEVAVGVPHSQGRGRGGAQSGGPLDEGALYDSTVAN